MTQKDIKNLLLFVEIIVLIMLEILTKFFVHYEQALQ
jgi:hypothetical protein